MKKNSVVLVGHAHIDAVWLWDHDETKDVLENTFTRILDLMDKYPDITFIQTSAQYYEWMETEYPTIYKRMVEKIKEGRWEVTGGMWVEPDCNMPDGESLCRQLLYAQAYFKEKFGKRTRICWLPDVFGFPWILPSLLKESGIDYFFTSKLIWQTKLPFPHNLFQWEGPDGKTVLGYQTPGLYNNLDVYDVYKQSVRFKRKTGLDYFLAPFGEGDHGGGLSEELVEMVHNQQHNMDITFGNAETYFDDIASRNLDMPTVTSELYLNTHRGTLSTQSRIKKQNQHFENSLNAIEKLEVLLSAEGISIAPGRLLNAWKCVLLNQFHDALPGSSIKKVYQDADADYGIIQHDIQTYSTELINKLKPSKTGTSVYNHLSWSNSRYIEVEAEADSIFSMAEKELNSAYLGDNKHLIYAENLPPISIAPLHIKHTANQPPQQHKGVLVTETSTKYAIANSHFSIAISKESGYVTSFTPKGKSNIVGGKGLGYLELFEDFTTAESAWNICRGKLYTVALTAPVEVVEQNSLRGKLMSTYSYTDTDGSTSLFKVCYVVHAESDILEYYIDVDWNAKYVTCQANFDYIESEPTTTYQMAYGTIDREDPFSDNADPYTREKWEVAGHRWAKTNLQNKDVSAVIVSNAKYGYGQKGNSMHLTLLRSPEYPNPSSMGLTPLSSGHTDQGSHTIHYGFKAVDSNISIESLHKSAKEFSDTPMVRQGAIEPKQLLSQASDGIFLNTIKVAEDGNGYILRLFETEGEDKKAHIDFCKPIQHAVFTNILEDTVTKGSVTVNQNTLTFDIGHNEIITIRINFYE